MSFSPPIIQSDDDSPRSKLAELRAVIERQAAALEALGDERDHAVNHRKIEERARCFAEGLADAARARVTELETSEAAIRAELLKYIEEPVDASEKTLALAAEVVQEAIISRDLADKPPVVPAGWRVSLFAGSWRLQKPERPATPSEAAAAFRALAHAIETDQCPHHKDDEGAKDEDPRAIMGPFEAHPFEALKRWADSELGVWPRGFGVMYDGQVFTVRATEGHITTRKAGRDLAECVKGITK